jgi:hypothetical protein
VYYPLIPLIVGALLLFFGRRLFWLFVAGAGFVIGMQLTPVLLPHQTEVVVFAVAIFLGISGALIAILFQELAIAVAGFLFGANLCSILFHQYFAGPEAASLFWIAVGIGGILGAVLMVGFFDWILILFSSLQGAHFILSVSTLPRISAVWVFVALTLLGILVQAAMLKTAGPRSLRL